MDPQVIIKNLTNRASKSANKVVLKPRRRKEQPPQKRRRKREELHTSTTRFNYLYIYIISTDKHDTRIYHRAFAKDEPNAKIQKP